MQFTFDTIGRIHSCYKQKFGIPRQAGLSPSTRAQIEILPPYNRPEAFAELTQASHIWVQFVFHENRRTEWKPKVKAPRLGGNKSMGVFATRSPVRPNPIGLSVVKLVGIEQHCDGVFLNISGGDFLDGTPVLDIKPYVPYSDCIHNAENYFASAAPRLLAVIISSSIKEKIQTTGIENLESIIIETLQLNPVPQYHMSNKKESNRDYVVRLFEYDIYWRIESIEKIAVFDIVKVEP